MSMFQQGFIMRQIQYLTQLLQQIIFKKKQQKPKEAIEDIHNAFNRLTKDRPQAFHELSLKDTVSVFIKMETFIQSWLQQLQTYCLKRQRCSSHLPIPDPKNATPRHFCSIRKRFLKITLLCHWISARKLIILLKS